MHRWQGCALHAMLEQRFLAPPARPLRGNRRRCAVVHPSSPGTQATKTALPKQSRKDTSETNQRLLNFKDLVLALPNIWSFLRFQPDFWLNTAVFLHIRF